MAEVHKRHAVAGAGRGPRQQGRSRANSRAAPGHPLPPDRGIRSGGNQGRRSLITRAPFFALLTSTPSKGTPNACAERFVPFPVPISVR